MYRPTIRQLEYLVTLEKEKSFLEAAAQCHVTQSTLSAGIQDLERILDQKLVNREKRKNITLTTFGYEVAQTARRILQETDVIVARAKQIKSPLTGPLRLGVIPTIAPYFLPQVLPKIQQDFPNLELQLYEDLSDRLVDKCMRGSLDLILMAFPFDTPDMTQMFLFEEPFTLACPKGHEPEGKTVISTGDLDPGELLLLEDGHCLSDHAIEACGIQKPQRRKAYSATSLQTLIQMVANNYGMTLLPEMASTSGNIPKGISILPFKSPKPTRKIGLAWKRRSPRKAEFETLGNALRQV